MSDLRPEDRITSSKNDGLAELIAGKVEEWENKRDVIYRTKWNEYERMWRGEWAPQDRDRVSERSRAIMPSIAQAVDSAVSEVEEAMFGRERWFDIDTDNPATQDDENQMGRAVADLLLNDVRSMKPGISQCALLAAVYGTGIGKLVIREVNGRIVQTLLPIQPREFAIDPAAETLAEAEGAAHVFHLPMHIVLERQRQGIYARVDPGSAPAPVRDGVVDQRHIDTVTTRIIEYQGLVPRNMLSDVSEPADKLAWEEDQPVEALVTVANDNVVMRAVENPLIGQDRGFVAFQWDTIPGHFWGRGIVEKGYWPQKVLDAEIRSRIDALGFSVHPMLAVNAGMVPRNADFAVRPGRNVFINGPPSEAINPLNFPPPDPQTYQQGQEMQRMIEMATGQLQAATPTDANGRNETASGMSMILGASIRRTRRTMANIERSFMQPLIRKTLTRFQTFDDRYPQGTFDMRIYGTLGMMAREFEQMQLTQLMNSLPPGPPQLMMLRAIVDNMSLVEKEGMIGLLDQLLEQSLQPQPEAPDLGGQARIMSAQTRQTEVEHQMRKDDAEFNMKQRQQVIDANNQMRNHERGIMAISVDADRAEAEEAKLTTESILNLAKAEAAELGQQLEQYKASLDALQIPGAPAPGEGLDLSTIQEALDDIRTRLNGASVDPGSDLAPINIERDPTSGLVTSVGGRSVGRDERGLINTVQ